MFTFLHWREQQYTEMRVCLGVWITDEDSYSALGAFAREDGVTTRANKEVILLQITDRLQAVHFVFVSCL